MGVADGPVYGATVSVDASVFPKPCLVREYSPLAHLQGRAGFVRYKLRHLDITVGSIYFLLAALTSSAMLAWPSSLGCARSWTTCQRAPSF